MTDVLERLAGVEPPGSSRRRYLLLDVFTATPLEGNQLAVFADGRGLEDRTMQAVARELKLSETVFVLPAEGAGVARARIFTPSTELPFAGHPVLGTAVALAVALGRTSVVLETGAGAVEVIVERGEGRVRAGEMGQPIPNWERFGAEPELLRALGVAESCAPVEIYANGPRHIMVALSSAEAVAALDPDLRALARVAGEAGVSCFAGGEGRFKTRMFAPGLGVEEDPATGSAAGPLAVHCARHGLSAYGTHIEISQGAEIGRPSLLRARADGSPEQLDAVRVGGDVVFLGRGEIAL